MDGRVGSGSHVKDLVKPEAQEGAAGGVEAALAEPRDQKIQAAQIAENTEKRLHEEGAIERREWLLFERGMEDLVGEVFALFPFEQRADARLARVGGHEE